MYWVLTYQYLKKTILKYFVVCQEEYGTVSKKFHNNNDVDYKKAFILLFIMRILNHNTPFNHYYFSINVNLNH